MNGTKMIKIMNDDKKKFPIFFSYPVHQALVSIRNNQWKIKDLCHVHSPLKVWFHSNFSTLRQNKNLKKINRIEDVKNINPIRLLWGVSDPRHFFLVSLLKIRVSQKYLSPP